MNDDFFTKISTSSATGRIHGKNDQRRPSLWYHPGLNGLTKDTVQFKGSSDRLSKIKNLVSEEVFEKTKEAGLTEKELDLCIKILSIKWPNGEPLIGNDDFTPPDVKGCDKEEFEKVDKALDNLIKYDALNKLYVEGGRGRSSEIIELGVLSDAEWARLDDIIAAEKNRQEPFDGYDLKELAEVDTCRADYEDLTPEEKEELWQTIKNRGLLSFEDANGPLDASKVFKLAQLSSEDWERAQDGGLLDNKKYGKMFEISDIINFLKVEPELFKTMQTRGLMDVIENSSAQPTFDRIENFAKLEDSVFEQVKDFFWIAGRNGSQFQTYEAEKFSKLDGAALAKAKKILYIPERHDKQFSQSYIEDLIRLDDVKFQRAQSLFAPEGRENIFNASSINDLLYLTDEHWKNVQSRGLITKINGGKELSSDDIIALAKLDDAAWEKAQAFFDAEGRETQLNGKEISVLVNSDENVQQKILNRNLLSQTGNDDQLCASDITKLAELEDETWKNVTARGLLTFRHAGLKLCAGSIAQLAKLDQAQWQKAQEVFKATEGIEYPTQDAKAISLSKFEEAQWLRAKTLLNIEGRKTQLSTSEIEKLTELNDTQWENLQKRKLLLDDTCCRAVDSYEIVELANLDDAQWEKTKTLLKMQSEKNWLNIQDICYLAKLDDNLWQKMLERKLHAGTEFKRRLEGYAIADFARLDNITWSKAKTLLNIEEREKKGFGQISANNVLYLANLDDDSWQKIRERNLAADVYRYDNIITLSRLDNKQWARAQKLQNAFSEKRNKLDWSDMAVLACMSDKEWENFQKRNLLELAQGGKPFSASNICRFAGFDDNLWAEFQKRKEYLESFDGRKFSNNEIAGLTSLDNAQWHRANGMLYIPKNERQLEYGKIVELAKNLGQLEWQRVQNRGLLDDKYANLLYYADNIVDVARLNDKHWGRFEELVNEKGRKQPFGVQEGIGLAKLEDEDWQNLQNRKLITKELGDNNSRNLDSSEIISFAKLDDTAWKRAKGMLDTGFLVNEALRLASLNDAEWSKIDERGLFGSLDTKRELTKNEIYSFTKLSDEAWARAKNILWVEERNNEGFKQFNYEDIQSLTSLPEDAWNNLLERELHKNAGSKRNFSSYDLKCLARLTNERWEIAKKFLFVEDRKEQFNSDNIATLARLDDEQLQNIEARNLVKDSLCARSFNATCLGELAKLDDAKWQLAKEILYLEARGSSQLSGSNIVQAVNLQESKSWEKIKGLLAVEGRNPQFSVGETKILTALPEEEFKRAKNFFLVEGRKTQFSATELTELSNFEPQQLQQAEELYHIEKRSNQLSGSTVLSLAKLDPVHFEQGKKVTFIENRPNQLTDHDILNIAKLDEEQYKKAEGLCFIKERASQFSGQEICTLAKCNENQWKIIEDNNLLTSRFTGNQIELLSSLTQEEYDEAMYIVNLEQNKGIYVEYAAAYTKLSPQEKETFNFFYGEAFKKRDQLKSGLEDLTNIDIANFFFSEMSGLLTAANILGETTVLNAFPLKLEGLEYLFKDCGTLKNSLTPEGLELLLQKFNYTNSARFKELNEQIAKLTPRATEIAEEYRPKFEELRAKQGEMSKIEYKEALNKLSAEQNAKMPPIKELRAKIKKMQEEAKPLDAKQKTKIQKATAITVIAGRNSERAHEFVKLLGADEKTWADAVNREVFDMLGISYNEELSKRLNLAGSEYLSEILSADDSFHWGFRDIVNLIAQNTQKSLKDILNELPQNITTKAEFEKLGINYDKWVETDKDSYIDVLVKTNEETAKKGVIESLEADLNDPAFKMLPYEQIEKLFEKLAEKEISLREVEEPAYDNDGFAIGNKKVSRLYCQNEPITFEQAEEAIYIIKDEINISEFWNEPISDPSMNSARETMRDHLVKLRYDDAKKAAAIKGERVSEIEVHKTDMNNLQHALFLGNHGACCTAVGGTNDFSAPTYVKNKLVSAIELMDGKDFVGNTMCYIAFVDGVPSLILDNIEVKTKYQYNDTVRDAIFEYAKKLTQEIGQPDMPIYAGPHRHKIDTRGLTQAKRELKIVGSTGMDRIYLDYITQGRTVNGAQADKVNLFEIRGPKQTDKVSKLPEQSN